MEKIVLRNSVHETQVEIRVKRFDTRMVLGDSQIRRIQATLCPTGSSCKFCKQSRFKMMGAQEAVVHNGRLYHIAAEDANKLFWRSVKEPVMVNWAGKVVLPNAE